MAQKSTESSKHLRLSHFRWVIGTPYFVQGTSTFTEIPILYFIKFTLEMGDAGGDDQRRTEAVAVQKIKKKENNE